MISLEPIILNNEMTLQLAWQAISQHVGLVEMRLEFPNVRLSLYNRLLAGEGDCLAVMIESAYDLGIVPTGILDGLRMPEGHASCPSLYAARKIVETFVDERGGEQSRKERDERLEKIWSGIEGDLAQYKDANQLEHSYDPERPANAKECSQMAPVVFDLMLQQIRRY